MMAGGLTLATAVEANSAASPAPTPDALQDDPLDQPTQLQAELRARDKAQVTAALKALSTQTDAFIAPALVEPRSTPVLVLPGRATPYDLAALAAQHPIALSARPDSAILLHLPVIVGPGATLGADATTARTVLLTSSARGYAPLIAAGGTIAFTGTAFQPLAVRSFDPSTGQADTDLTDGRAYVSASATRMDLDHVVASDLGFLVGETSGVAWMARGGTPSSGGASDSTFTRNYFGAYSSGAVGLVFKIGRAHV